MSYADGLLSSGERILYRNKQHPFVFIWGARYTILALVFAFLLFVLQGGLGNDGASGTIRTIMGIATAVLFFGGLAVAVWTGLRYINQEYVLTNRRVISVEGVLNRAATDSGLEKINDAALSQSVFGRMFDFGDLTVLTASESGIEKMKMIRSPIAFKKHMLDAKHEYEVDMERSGWAPAPPIRDGSTVTTATSDPGAITGSTAVAAAPVATAAAPASTMSPDDVTRTLASLADLRDRGAISPEEYERKKAELLGRL